MNPDDKGSIEAWVPRSLISNGLDVAEAPCTKDGLSPLRFSWIDGQINSIDSILDSSELPLKLILPRMVEAHSHIDKAFTWNHFPNFEGTYKRALQVNLKEHKHRTSLDVKIRAEKALSIALRNGIRAIRTHVDSFDSADEKSWDVLISAR